MSTKREITTRGVVIGRSPTGEGSIRAVIYTEALGYVAAVAKSAREERSKLRAHLTAGTVGTFTLVKGERDWRVTGACNTVHTHFVLGESAKPSYAEASKAKQEAVGRILALVRSLVHGEGVDRGLYSALSDFLTTLPSTPLEEVTTAERRAALRILAALGYVSPSDMNSSDIVGVINRGLAASGLV